MKLFLLAGAFAALAVVPALAQAQDLFTACATQTGTAYIEARDKFLASPADDAFLKKKRDSDSWREQLAALILLGWREHQKEYRQLLAAPKVRNQKGESHFPWAVMPGGIKLTDIPLMYELLTKDVDRDGARDAANALTALVLTAANEEKPLPVLDIEVLHKFLRDKAAAGRDAVARLIGSLPPQYQEKKALLDSLKAEMARGDKDTAGAVASSLLRGVDRLAEKLTPGDKDKLVGDVLALQKEGLDDLVGGVAVTYTVGGIGGNEASKVVAEYLEKSKDALEKRWALRTLARSDSPMGRQKVLEYAQANNPDLKIEGLALEAAHSLAKISAQSPTDRELQQAIQSRLQTISAKTDSKNLKDEVESILKKIKDRMK